MPVAINETSSLPIAQDPPRKRLTRADCAVLEEAGAFDQERVELIEGELIIKMPKKRRHVRAVTIMCRWLEAVFGPLFVNQEAPIDVAPEDNPTNEPEPDLIVLRPNYVDSWSDQPQSHDVALIVEIADSTLTFDRTVKARLYARAGIPEYWLWDLQGRRLIVHRDPRNGQYETVIAYSEQESVAPLAAPDRQFRIADVFPPTTESGR